MNVLLTGASGFLGSHIKAELQKDQAVVSIGRSSSNDVRCDLSTSRAKLDDIQCVIHAAGKAHIYPRTEQEKKAFFDVNVEGTHNLLFSLDSNPISRFVFISSVSVYGLEQGILIPEDTSLNGKSPYALSKIKAEAIIQSWCESKSIPYLILRLPLVVGTRPLGNLGKMLHAIQSGKYIRIAKGDAKKSAVLASDVSILIHQWLKSKMPRSGIYNLTDSYHPSFYELEEGIRALCKKGRIPSIPIWLATWLGQLGDRIKSFPVNTQTIKKITCSFTFSDEKAKREIGWSPRKVLDNLDCLKQ